MCRALEEEGVIEKVNLAEAVDCILNIAISEKKVQGCIRMNIDTRPYNKGAKHTRYHVTTPKEARHKLKGAKIFSEFDMGNGFHHVPLHTDSHVVFQSHLGLHKMKRLFFGPSNSSGIFHHKVTKVFRGLEGCITIHDNLLVYGANEKEHNGNMAAMLEWAKKKGVTLKLSKSTICEPEVKRFGRIFLGAGVSVDPDKILHIVQAGKPESIEDVRSLLQAVAYNAKYGFDHKEDQSYEEVTAPLRKLLIKDAVFKWDEECDYSFQTLIRMMDSRTYLAPYDRTKKTHLVTDASPSGIGVPGRRCGELGTSGPHIKSNVSGRAGLEVTDRLGEPGQDVGDGDVQALPRGGPIHVMGGPQVAPAAVQRHDQDRAGEGHQAQEQGAGPPLYGQVPGGEGHTM